MAVNDRRLEVTEFDFDEVKENLKIFLRAQNEFTDYDFEGSGMNILCLLYTSPSPRDLSTSRMPSSA